jgi:hypothetical protein
MTAETGTRRGPGNVRWSELTRAQRAAIIALGAAEVALTLTAAADLLRRPQEQLRGEKTLWWPVLAIQPFGPIAYLTLARKRPPQ